MEAANAIFSFRSCVSDHCLDTDALDSKVDLIHHLGEETGW